MFFFFNKKKMFFSNPTLMVPSSRYQIFQDASSKSGRGSANTSRKTELKAFFRSICNKLIHDSCVFFLAAVGNTRLWFAELHFWCQRRPARAPDATAGNAFGESIVQQPSSELLRKVLAWRLLGLTTFLLEVDEIGRCHKLWQLKAVLPKRRGQENFAERAAAWVQQHRIYTVALFFFLFLRFPLLLVCSFLLSGQPCLVKKNASSTKATVGAHV